MLDPVAQQERVVLVEIAVVEHQEKLSTVRSKSLDRMWNAWREVPEIANANVVDKIPAVSIDPGDTRRSVEHVGPFRSLMPMQLAHTAGIQAHVDTSDVLGNAKLANRDLPGPTA